MKKNPNNENGETKKGPKLVSFGTLLCCGKSIFGDRKGGTPTGAKTVDLFGFRLWIYRHRCQKGKRIKEIEKEMGNGKCQRHLF